MVQKNVMAFVSCFLSSPHNKVIQTHETAVDLVTPCLLYLSAGPPPLPQWGGTPGAAAPGRLPPAYVPPYATLHWSAIQANRTLTNGATTVVATSPACESVNIPMTADSW